MDVGGGAPMHRHDEEEAFIVLEGRIEATVDGETLSAPAGYTLRVPSGAAHEFRSVGPGAARLIVAFPIHDPLAPEHTVYLEGARADTRPAGDGA